MSQSTQQSRELTYRLWPERRSGRWIHGIALLVVGGTFVSMTAAMIYGMFTAEGSLLTQLSAIGPALTVATITAAITVVPYALGSMAAQTVKRAYWIVGACGLVGLSGLGFRIYAYGVVGGGQAFVNMILHVVPYSTLVLAGWAIALWRSIQLDDHSPPGAVLGAVGLAILLGLIGSIAGWLLRDSPTWITVGPPLGLASIGLGFWAVRRARQESGRA